MSRSDLRLPGERGAAPAQPRTAEQAQVALGQSRKEQADVNTGYNCCRTHANGNLCMGYAATETPADPGILPCLQQGTKPDVAGHIDPPPPGWILDLLPAALSLLMHLY